MTWKLASVDKVEVHDFCAGRIHSLPKSVWDRFWKIYGRSPYIKSFCCRFCRTDHSIASAVSLAMRFVINLPPAGGSGVGVGIAQFAVTYKVGV